MNACPNITSQEWQNLVDAVGENGAWIVYGKHGTIPEIVNPADLSSTIGSMPGVYFNQANTPMTSDRTIAQKINQKYANVRASLEPSGSVYEISLEYLTKADFPIGKQVTPNEAISKKDEIKLKSEIAKIYDTANIDNAEASKLFSSSKAQAQVSASLSAKARGNMPASSLSFKEIEYMMYLLGSNSPTVRALSAIMSASTGVNSSSLEDIASFVFFVLSDTDNESFSSNTIKDVKAGIESLYNEISSQIQKIDPNFFVAIVDKYEDLANGGSTNASIKPQKAIVASILETAQAIDRSKKVVSQKTGKENRYIDKEGFIFESRPSDASNELFAKGKTEEQAEAENKNPVNVMYRETGTHIHALFEATIRELLPNYSNLEDGYASTVPAPKVADVVASLPEYLKDPSILVSIRAAANIKLQELNKTQLSIDPSKTAFVFSEALLADKKRSIAGTEDLITIFSDSSAAIYDFKSVHMKRYQDEAGNIKYTSKHLSPYKVMSYESQLVEYKEMLKNVYGVSTVRNVRVIPIQVEYELDKNGIPIESINSFDVGTSFINDEGEAQRKWLAEVPLTNEFTGIENIDKLLRAIYSRQKEVTERIKKSYGDPAKHSSLIEEQNKLQEAVVEMFNYGTVGSLIDSYTVLSERINTPMYAATATLEELVDMARDVAFFKDNLLSFKNLTNIPGIKADDTKKIQADIEGQVARIAGHVTADYSKIIADMQGKLSSQVGFDVTAAARELSTTDYAVYMGSIQHPLFRAAYKLIREQTDKAELKTQTLINETEKLRDKIKQASGGNLQAFYESLIERVTTKKGDLKEIRLVRKYSSSFYEALGIASGKKDAKFIKDNFELKADANDIFQAIKRQAIKDFLKHYPADSEIFKERLKAWEESNDIFQYPALAFKESIRMRYFNIKENEAFFSEEYKNLSKDPVKKEVYDYLTEKNREFNSLVDEKISYNFIPKVQKDLLDHISEGKVLGSTKEWFKRGVNSLKVSENDTMLSTEKESKNIPLPYYDNFTFYNKETGKYITSATEQSTDLLYNLMVFGDAVYTKAAMTSMAPTAEAAKLLLRTHKTLKTNGFGNIVKDPNTGNLVYAEKDDTAIDIFEKLTNAMVYGKTLQSKDTLIGDYSMNKTLSKAMSIMSLKSLGGNWRSSIAGGINGFLNTRIMSAQGRYFNKKQWQEVSKSYKDPTELKRYAGIAEIFNLEDEGWVERRSRTAAGKNLLNRTVRADNAYFLQRYNEKFVANQILYSMLKNYGIDPSNPNEIRRLDLLPEGTKSLDELIKLDGDSVSLPKEISEEAFTSFKRKVTYVVRRAKGTQSKVEFTAMNAHIAGRMFSHFRNWIQPTISARFGGINLNAETEEWTMGRYNALLRYYISNDPSVKGFIQTLSKMSATVATFGMYKYTANEEAFKRSHEIFVRNNPDKNISYEEYKLLMEDETRAAIVEARILLSILLISPLLNGIAYMIDPEDDEFYKNLPFVGVVFALLDRLWLEMTFYLMPDSALGMLKSPVPLLGLAKDVFDVFSEITDESTDLIFGEDQLTKTGKSKDKKNLTTELSDLFPFINHAQSFADAAWVTADQLADEIPE